MQRVEQLLREHCAGNGVLTPIFSRGVTLVPMPRSAPLVAAAFWPAERICNAIVAAGLAARIAPVLRRTAAVPKSSRAPPGGRPLVSRHFETLSAQALLDMGSHIVLVDDVVTKGSTALAAAFRLAECYPEASITLFAAVRTKGLVPEIDRIIEPTSGMIYLAEDEGDRRP
jgi:predicted amidophosphoribosyltransferase